MRKQISKKSIIRKEIRLLPQQLKILEKGAKNHHVPISRFIPQAALSYCNDVFMIPDKKQIQQVAMSCREVSTALYQMAEQYDEHKNDTMRTALDMVAVLEQSLFHILHHPPKLSVILRQAFQDPKLKNWLFQQCRLLQEKA